MKLCFFALVLALLLGSSIELSAQEATPSAADGPVLAIYVSDLEIEPDANDEVGDPCFFSWSPLGMGWTMLDHQIIVRDQSNSVIAIHTLDPVWSETGSDELSCVDSRAISVPQSPFYQVYLNDQWIVALTPETLPTDPERGLYISLSPAPWD